MPIDPGIYNLQQPVKFNNPFEQLGQIREQQQRQQLIDQQIRSGQAQEEDRRVQTADRQKKQTATDQINLIMSGALQDSPDGIKRFDENKVLAGLAEKGLAAHAPEILESLNKSYEASLSVRKIDEEYKQKKQAHVNEGLAAVGFGIDRSGNTPEAFYTGAALAKANYGLTDEQLAPYIEAVEKDGSPATVGKITQALIALSPTYTERYSQRQRDVETARHNAATEAQAAKPPLVAEPKAGTLEEYIASVAAERGKTVKQLSPYDRLVAKRKFEEAGRAPTTDHEPLVPIVGPDGKSILVPRSQAVNKQPASSREQTAGTEDLVKAVIKSPGLWDQLTPSDKGRIAGGLEAAGFGDLGKPLPPAAVNKISDAKTAVDALKDLKTVLKENEQYIGPVAGYQALNPYSDARKAQGKIEFVRQKVGKALEGGVLRKEDETKYKKMLSELTDTPSTALSKANYMVEQLENDLQNFINEQRLSGRRVATTSTGRTDKPASAGPKKIGRFEVVED